MATVPQARKVCDLDREGVRGGTGKLWILQTVDRHSGTPGGGWPGRLHPDDPARWRDLRSRSRPLLPRSAVERARSRHSLRAHGYDVLVWVRFSPPRAASLSGKPIPMMSVPIIGHGGVVTPSSGFGVDVEPGDCLARQALSMGRARGPDRAYAIHPSADLAKIARRASRCRHEPQRRL
jgi:hypothetical protein